MNNNRRIRSEIFLVNYLLVKIKSKKFQLMKLIFLKILLKILKIFNRKKYKIIKNN